MKHVEDRNEDGSLISVNEFRKKHQEKYIGIKIVECDKELWTDNSPAITVSDKVTSEGELEAIDHMSKYTHLFMDKDEDGINKNTKKK